MWHEEIIISYSEKDLIKCSNLIAEDLRLPYPQSQEVLEKLTEILVTRENYASMVNNLITIDELANLVFQHLDTLIKKGSDTTTRTYTMEREIHAQIKQALISNAT